MSAEEVNVKILLILNDPPYGTERVFNGLRLGINLLTKQSTPGEVVLDVFLIGDAAGASKSGQRTPDGYYNIEKMLMTVLRKGGSIEVCGTCMDARGLSEGDLIEGATRSSMDELTALTMAADNVLVF
jgi:uncharacterized protein involved in oxidation of intracellular sulfur